MQALLLPFTSGMDHIEINFAAGSSEPLNGWGADFPFSRGGILAMALHGKDESGQNATAILGNPDNKERATVPWVTAPNTVSRAATPPGYKATNVGFVEDHQGHGYIRLLEVSFEWVGFDFNRQTVDDVMKN